MKSIFRISRPGFMEPSQRDQDALSQIATAVPQMPTLTPGAAGTLNFQAQSPDVGIGLINAAMERQQAAAKTAADQKRWNIEHLDDVARGQMIQQAGSPDVRMPSSLSPGLQPMQSDLGEFARRLNANRQKYLFNEEKAFQATKHELDNDPSYQATLTTREAVNKKRGELAASALPESLKRDEEERQRRLDEEVAKRKALLPVVQSEIDLKNAGYHKDREDELAFTVREAEKLAKIRGDAKVATETALTNFRTAHPQLSARDGLTIHKHALDQMQLEGWDEKKIQADPPAFARELSARMDSVVRSVGGTQRKYSGTRDARDRRFGGLDNL